jgi:hypothetical protein
MAVTEKEAYKTGQDAFDATVAQFKQMGGGGMTERIAGGIIAVTVVAIVLNQLFTLQIVNTTSGPFSGLLTTVESVGTGALTLVVLGFLAAAGGAAIAMFRGGF